MHGSFATTPMRRYLRQIAAIVFSSIVLLCPSQAIRAASYEIGMYAGALKLNGGTFFDFKMGGIYGLFVERQLENSWRLKGDFSFAKLHNRIDRPLTDNLGTIHNNDPLDFNSLRFGASIERLLFSSTRRFNLTIGAGVGMMRWKMTNPVDGSTYESLLIGEQQGKRAFSASELFVSTSAGLQFQLTHHFLLTAVGRVDYLTGAGANFSAQVNDVRDLWLGSISLGLAFRFGARDESRDFASSENWSAPAPVRPHSRRDHSVSADSDHDGVPDSLDQCPKTPPNAIVDAHGCPIDSDGDGVPDIYDDCPNTPPAAYGKVDIHGCPIDSDFDGVPDYLDQCPHNQIGAAVDSVGCPIDSDHDGVPDGLDDCPGTLPGIPVDQHGCLDMIMFAGPMILNVDYSPGSFEFDQRTRERLEKLARVLLLVPNVRLDISAYTDDIGSDAANIKLSEKRANRIRDFLVVNGVATERIKPYGRGKISPVASNQTADGRSKNRRIEILFYK